MSFIDEMNMKASSNDVYFFTEEVLGLEVKHFHKRWLHDLTHHHRNTIICSRDHGKSTICSLAFPLWTTIFSPQINTADKIDNNDTIILSNSLDQSHMLMDRIRVMIEEVDILQSVSWIKGNKGKIGISEKGNHNTIESKSFGSSIRGLHPRFVIVDDPLSERSSMTDDGILEFFFSSLSNVAKNDSYISVIGTRFSYKDLYSVLSEPERGYNVSTFPAMDANDNPLWPERYSYEHLMGKRAEVGALPFSREFMCIPMDDSASIFPGTLTESCLNKSYSFETEGDGESRYLISADFAIGTTATSDYSVVTTLKDDLNGNISIADIWRETGKEYDVQINAIRERYERFNPVQIHVENNVFQAIFEQILKKERLPVVGVTTKRQDKENNTYLLRSLMENQKIILPYGNEYTRKIIDELKFELSMFGYKNGKLMGKGAHDDMVMSLTIGTKGMVDLGGVVTDGKIGSYTKPDSILGMNFDYNPTDFASPWNSTFIEGLGIR